MKTVLILMLNLFEKETAEVGTVVFRQGMTTEREGFIQMTSIELFFIVAFNLVKHSCEMS